MVRLSVPVDASWGRANARAIEQAKLGRRARPNGWGRYLVESSTGTHDYEVRIINVGRLEATCTCKHASSGAAGHCFHIAAALAAEIARVSRPAPATGAEARMARFARP